MDDKADLANTINALLAEGRQAEAAARAQALADPLPKKVRAARKASEAARCCAACGADIGPQEPVWIGRVGYPGYSVWTYIQAPLCVKCNRNIENLHTRYFPALPCASCRRPVHLLMTKRRGAAVVCSENCRKALYRARYFARKGSREATCAVCGKAYTQKRSDARTCSPACRQKAYRQRVTGAKRSSTSHSHP
jgi:hypothetical protein